MENTRGAKGRTPKRGKVGQFILLPNYVLNTKAYISLNHPSIRLLLEVARQYNGKNNGDLTIIYNQLNARGWKSNDVIQRAKTELLNKGFIQETRKGERPNKASLYAITWQPLNIMDKFDIGAGGFKKDAFLSYEPP